MKRNLALLIFSSLLIILISELLLRYFSIYKSYNERSSENGVYLSPFVPYTTVGFPPFQKIRYSKSEFTTNWLSNNEGLKDKTISISKNGKRILFFGDSFTEGVGAPNDSAFPRIFEKLVKLNGDSALEIINCGLSGADLFSEYKLLSEKMLKYQPDYIILTFNTTDFDEFAIRGGFERFSGKSNYHKAPWFESIYAKSYLVRLIIHKAFRYNYSFLTPRQQVESDQNANLAMSGAIDSFLNLCNSNRIKLGIMFHPRSFEIKEPEKYRVAELIGHCIKMKVPFADALIFFKQNKISAANLNTLYWEKDGHLQSKGYELLANCAYRFYTERLR